MNLPTQYLTLIIGLVIGVLFGTGITDWRALLEKDSFTDWIMVVCSVGILYFSYKAYKHTEKTWKVTRLTEQLDLLNEYYTDYIYKYDVLLSNNLNRITTLYNDGFFEKIDKNKFIKTINKIVYLINNKELIILAEKLKKDIEIVLKNYNLTIKNLNNHNYSYEVKINYIPTIPLKIHQQGFQKQYKLFEDKVNNIISES